MNNGQYNGFKFNANILLFCLIIGMIVTLIFLGDSLKKPMENMAFDRFISMVKNKEINSVVFDTDRNIFAQVKESNGKNKTVHITGDTESELYKKILYDNGIIPSYKEIERPSFFLTFIIQLFPLLIFFFLAWFLLTKAGAAGRSGFSSVGKAGATMGTITNVTFEDVAGVDEAKEELEEIVDFLKNPKKFTQLGGRLPKGALLVGPPGTGKTLLAKAVSGEAKVPFFSISGSQFVEMFVGVGASRVRNLFDQARKHSPCIIFIDEIDAIGKHRGNNISSGGNDEREQTLNQLLVEMDGFEASSGIIILAATNRVDTLDPALLRPGRFDRRIFVSLPDILGREKILKTHARKIQVDPTVDFSKLARGTAGMNGADLGNLVNEAAIVAAKFNKKLVDMQDFEFAKDKSIMGVERKSMIIGEEEKKTTAYHEIGHALISKLIKGLDPLYKVSIIPRGRALGVTQTMPDDNALSLSKDKAESLICMLLGGRAAEELVFGHFTTGASNDLEKATQLAKRMVCEWGMSKKFGPISFVDSSGYSSAPSMSSETQRQIEDEIREVLDSCYKRAFTLLSENVILVHRLSESLIQKETLESYEVDEIIEKYRKLKS